MVLNRNLTAWQLSSLFFLTLVCYFITLKVPFYLDDASSISDNMHILGLPVVEVFKLYGMRGVAYASFAVNYQATGLDVSGFHITNIGVHFLSASFVYLLTKECCRAQQLPSTWLPFIVAMFFVCHPLHTQAVTYIVQRIASLAGLFYFSALYFYLLLRRSSIRSQYICYGFLTLAAMLLAFFTKQNTIVLPLSILLLELLVVCRIPNRYQVVSIAGLVSAVVLALLALTSDDFQSFLVWLDAYTRETADISRLAYFETQIRVVGEYIQRFFVPINLQLEYTTPVYSGSFQQVSGYLWLHIGILTIALLASRKVPLATFGILFYYSAHIVESSFIPISDVAFDHRTYIPNFGLILAVVIGSYYLLKKAGANKPVFVVPVVIVMLIATTMTIQRNRLWLDPMAFYKYELAISTNKARVHNALAQLYMDEEQWKEASEHFEQAVVLTEDDEMRPLFISNYIAAVKNDGNVAQAIALTEKYLPVVNSNQARKQLLTNLGFMYIQKREASNAFNAFKRVMTMDRRPPPNEANLGMALALWALKRQDQAKIYLQRTISNDPKNDYAKQLLEKLIAQGF
ncbi:hypothetical protein FLM48_14130 [Shewanella sp. Scap07]|uniref:tetratricopeptide repeat protein n=1 Tax=Shewanella sp. Scap07 TaxID=2589987 RepID=UPI0015BCDF80|nr:hypothetical protein [Shewanella sp. Scap07]QLE86105.1 hypothetical protein FLM48_14130 [Shewanella sp. Scap07]